MIAKRFVINDFNAYTTEQIINQCEIADISIILNPNADSIFDIVSIDKFSVPFNTRDIYC